MEAYVIKRIPCPACREQGGDVSGNNLVVYSDGGQHCFACDHHPSSRRSKVNKKKLNEMMETKVVEKKEKKITQEQNEILKSNTTSDVEFRGVRPETNRYFGVRYSLTDDDELDTQFVPCTTNYELSGYKVRTLPKTFGTPLGEVGSGCEMVGQFRFRYHKQTVLIVGGELDMLSAYQMLRDNQIARGKGEYEAVAVVSSSVGEGGAFKQAAKQYDWFSKFDKIIVALDNDEAGREATEKLVKNLPKGKVYTIEWSLKDPNSYMWNTETNMPVNREKDFITDYYKMKKYVPAGVVGSNTLLDKVIENAMIPKVPFPPFMTTLEDMTAGGIPLGYIINIGAASGIGKSSIVNEMVYYWVFNSPHMIGVVSMELDAGQYGEMMLSRHLGRKIALISDSEQKLDFLQDDGVQYKAEELFSKEDGTTRWWLMDDRDGSVEALMSTVEELIVSCGCKVIIIDPLQDVLDGMTNEEQAVFMRWQKSMIKSHQVTFININHTRKTAVGSTAGGNGAFITEEDFAGSSTIFKSAGANILLMRDKYSDDPLVKNTTEAIMSKCRWTGNTGKAGSFYYDNETHTMYDLDKWLEMHPKDEF